jgi:hypothetical protein
MKYLPMEKGKIKLFSHRNIPVTLKRKYSIGRNGKKIK